MATQTSEKKGEGLMIDRRGRGGGIEGRFTNQRGHGAREEA